MKLLIADDDPQMVRALRITLAAHGYEVVVAPDGAAAVAAAAQTHPRPHHARPRHASTRRHRGDTRRCADGRTCRSSSCLGAPDPPTRSRRWMPVPTTSSPSRSRSTSCSRGFVHCPRRSVPVGGESTVGFGDVVVDLATKTVTRAGARVHLTPTEWRMLEHLARHPGALVTRQDLPEGDLGQRTGVGLGLPAAVHVTAAQEARGRAQHTGAPADRVGHGLSARTLSLVSVGRFGLHNSGSRRGSDRKVPTTAAAPPGSPELWQTGGVHNSA